METGILEGVSERTVINVSRKHWLYKNCKEFKNMLSHIDMKITSARVLGNILGNLKKYLFEKYFFNSK